MKALTHYRSAALRVAVAVLFLSAGISAFVSASSLPTAGSTGQALALKAALHPERAAVEAKRLLDASNQWPHLPNGRLLQPSRAMFGASAKPHASNPSPIIINEGVQTLDVFAPPPAFTEGDGGRVYENRTPVWSADESFIVFASNRPSTVAGDLAGKFHLWAISSRGDAGGQNPTLTQITSGNGNELFPALDTVANNNLLAFASDANSPNNYNLYVIGGQSGVPFVLGQGPLNVGTPQIAGNPACAKTLGDVNLTNVTRSTFSPGGDRIAFAATTPSGTTGQTGGVQHIFFLYVANNGYQAQPALGVANPPAQITDGRATDSNPAWSPDGNYIIFDSTATIFQETGNQISPSTAPLASQSVGGGHRLFMFNGGASAALGTLPNALADGTRSGGQVDVTGFDDVDPAWSTNLQNQYFNPFGTLEYISFARGPQGGGNHNIVYFRLTNSQSGATQGDANAANRPITVETAAGGGNAPVTLNTSDANNDYDDTYPTWAPFQSIFSIAYQSPRSVTYNRTSATDSNIPVETAINLPQGATAANTGNAIGSGYFGILESQVLNLDPPTLLRYNGAQVIRVTNDNGNETRNIQPSVSGQRTHATFTVRLSNREAGTDPSKVFLQIKDPDSRYQDSQSLEHKVFANSNDTFKDPNSGVTRDSGSGSARRFLFNGFGSTGAFITNGTTFFTSGAIGGWDTKSLDDITVGHQSVLDPNIVATNPILNNVGDLSAYRSWGPEYECQYVNPTVLDPSTNLGDYGVPFYLAGVDDQEAFSGSIKRPRPTTNDPTQTDPRNQFAQWVQLTQLPVAQQDNAGGVLYGVTYTTPISASDFYLDVIAYDQAAFPAIQAFPSNTPIGPTDYHGRTANWRIYDNVGGFTTATFNGNNDILVVIDNGLGQKFSASTFGGQNGNSNLIPAFFGAESYYTDVDEQILPNAIDGFTIDTPVTPPTTTPAPAVNGTRPTNLKAYPGNATVTLQWTGVVTSGGLAPTSYNIYRSLTGPFTSVNDPNVTLLATIPGNSPTQYIDNAVTNNTSYWYGVTDVYTTESALSNIVSTTPRNFAGPTPIGIKLSTFDVLNGLGVGSYNDNITDDNGRISILTPAVDANGNPTTTDTVQLPSGSTTVPYVQSQKYSLWRILARGPVPTNVLAGYQPNFTTQPAVADTQNKVTVAAAPSVPVAQRCMIWVSPYTGNLPLVDAGSLENQTTQDALQAFVKAGGRLCLTGQSVAASLSLGGSTANTFLSGALGANYASTNGGNQNVAGAGNRISGFSGFDGSLAGGSGVQFTQGNLTFNPRPSFGVVVDGGIIVAPVKPSANPLLLGNDQGYNRGGDNTLWRADASLDQLGPFVLGLSTGFSPRTNIFAIAQINTITASGLANTTQDMTTNGNLGLLYYENYAAKADGTPNLAAGFGSRVVFGSFGLEGISQDYYRWNDAGGNPHWDVHNQRSNILHNIVCYLRTGTFTGRVTQASGQGVNGATVYLRPARGGTIPGPRQLFSALTGFDGSYIISGVEPGTYAVTAYKSGFNTSTSNVSYGVEGDTSRNVGLVIAPVPPGRLSGKVTDSAGNGINSVTVTFKSADGQVTVTGVTGPDGTYNIDNVPIGAYSGTASKQPQYTDATTDPANPPVVLSGQTTTVNFTLVPQPATVAGVVFNDLDGDGSQGAGEPGVGGATVTFIPQASGATTPPAVTTAADGSYKITGLAPGTYTISVKAPLFQTNATRSVTVQPGDNLTGRNIPLTAAPPILPGSIGGLVADAYTGKPLGGATVTIVDTATSTTVATVTTSNGTSTPGAPAGDSQPLNYIATNLPPGSYNVTVTLAGFGTQTVSNQAVLANTFTRVDFTSANGNPLQPIHVFGAGYNFFSVPYDYSAAGVSINDVFGTLNTGTRAAPSAGSNRSHLFVWSPVLLQYLLDPTPPADGLHLGQGYWVYLNGPTEVTKTGNLPTTVTIPVSLHRGWNQIGVPSLTPISLSRVTFANAAGGGSISFAQASSNTFHLVSGTLYGYNGTEYVAISGSGSLQTWQSYWIFAFADTTILLPTGGG